MSDKVELLTTGLVDNVLKPIHTLRAVVETQHKDLWGMYQMA